MPQDVQENIKLIIGLGNPGKQYAYTRHNIGFLVVDEIVQRHGGSWKTKGNMEIAQVTIHDHTIFLVKPQTYMNSSGQVLAAFTKQGIKASNILVVHDELELPFGKIAVRQGGSHRGHNGLRSLMEIVGPDFWRVRWGIGRPECREDVSDYVLTSFIEKKEDVSRAINQAADEIEKML